MFDFKFHRYQSMKLQLSYEIMFGYVQKLQIAHLIPLKTINIVSYNTFSKPRPDRAGPVFRLDHFRGYCGGIYRRKRFILTKSVLHDKHLLLS